MLSRAFILLLLLLTAQNRLFSSPIHIIVYNNVQTGVFDVDSLPLPAPDSLSTVMDTILLDSLNNQSDSLETGSENVPFIRFAKDSLEAQVDYNARDSIVYNVVTDKMFLYGDAEMTFKKIVLKAEFIEIDWTQKLLTAEGLKDSIGRMTGSPIFKEGDEQFGAERMIYNFETKKGKIFNMRAEEGEGYILVDEGKKNENDELFGSRARYTTCEHPEPHFYIESAKMKAVPNKLLVTGPANLVIEGVRTPLVLPFGIFPISKGQRSGILPPTYGESRDQGFFLRNGGYYFAINDYFDLALRGDIYSRGSYRLNTSSRYTKRYKYNGSFSFDYASNRFGDKLLDNFRREQNFFIRWNHNQDPKARPNSRFTANVGAGTSTYHTNNTFTTNDYINNQFNSNVSYTRNWPGRPFNLNVNLRHNQSTQTRRMDLTLPDVAFSVTRIYPFKRKVSVGKKKWYEQIGITYTMNTKALLSGPDSVIFKNNPLENLRWGMRHNIPVNAPIKLFKYFTFNPSFNYTELWYPEYITRRWDPGMMISGEDTITGFVQIDTVNKFSATRFFNVSASLSTRLFGMLQFKKGKLKAIRHVMTPTVSFNYRPDFGAPQWNNYGETITTDNGTRQSYSIYQGGIYGTPPSGQVGGIGLSLGNVLEMKVFNKKDTVNYERKIKLLESLNISTFYNLAADSLKLSNISINGRTTLFDRININFSSSFDPYAKNENGRRINVTEWEQNKRLLRFNTGNIAIGTSLTSGKVRKKGKSTAGTQEERDFVTQNGNYFVDFNVPWQFRIDYNLSVNNISGSEGTDSLITRQSVQFNGSLNLTPKWKIVIRSGYDFQSKDFTYTTVDLYRDLHCWEMSFNWVPFGPRQSYAFTINVKSAVLQDLKLSRNRLWFDQ